MSLAPEKFNSIFRAYDMLFMLCISKKCKIPKEWRQEIKWAIKHQPSTYDIHVEGKRFHNEYTKPEINALIRLVKQIDSQVKPRKYKRKKK